MTEDRIERPRGRRESLDLRPSEPAAQDTPAPRKISLKIGRKSADSSDAPAPQEQEIFTASRVQESAGDRYESSPETGQPSAPRREISFETANSPGASPKSGGQRSVSIDLGTASRPAQQRSLDLEGGAGHPVGSVGQGIDGPGSELADEEEPVKRPRGLGSILPLGGRDEDRKGTWKGTGYSASDDDAHRQVVYRIPSMMTQTMWMFMVQMKLFAKLKWTYFMLFAALLIPIAVVLASDYINLLLSEFGFVTGYSTTYIAGLLCMMPLMMGLFTSVLCGTQIPNEFKERTAYMNVSLPMSRISFYLGKYLAGFMLCLGVFVFAYGMAVAVSTTKYDLIFSDLLAESLAITIAGVFAYSATAFCIGSFMRRGSSMIPFILMSVVLPMVCILYYAMFQDSDPTWILMLPCFLCEAALGILGAQMSGSAGMIIIPMMDMTATWTMVAIGIVWGIAFLLLGMYRTMRREM